jgi:redox-sensing transcriptional repressor
MKESSIPKSVILRLPLYLRHLEELNQRGIPTVSSQVLGDELDLNPAQIRKDLAFFGDFGRKGIGYNVSFLTQNIQHILRLDEPWDVALAGVGRLGMALCDYSKSRHRALTITHAFDANEEKVGMVVGDVTILSASTMSSVLREYNIRIGVIAVPATAAQEVCDEMVGAGVTALLNFAPVLLKVPKHVHIRSADFTSELQSLAYYASTTNGYSPSGKGTLHEKW